jgi:acyl-CoA thioester hydrolase
MSAFVKKMEVRWADLDPNRHLASTAYGSLFVEARFAFMESNGFGQREFQQHGIGPVVLWERFHYLREIGERGNVFVDLALKGASEDRLIYRFAQSLFDREGALSAYAEITFGWLDLKTRKLIVPPPELERMLGVLDRAADFETLTKQDARVPGVPTKRKLDVSGL